LSVSVKKLQGHAVSSLVYERRLPRSEISYSDEFSNLRAKEVSKVLEFGYILSQHGEFVSDVFAHLRPSADGTAAFELFPSPDDRTILPYSTGGV